MKKRLDVALVEQGLAMSRTQAQAFIMAGEVSAGGKRLDKPGHMMDETIEIHLKNQPRFVGRAGEKLASVADQFKLNFKDKLVLDVGSSTGGFTDFALQSGAARVYCVDVGTAQLAYKLRQDPRVVVMEQTDIRLVKLGEGVNTIPAAVDVAVMDVSFISITKVLDVTAELVKPDGYIVAMAKPQFEAGKQTADEYRGVIPVGPVRDEILNGLTDWLLGKFSIIDRADSGLSGAEGNVEHFFLLQKPS